MIVPDAGQALLATKATVRQVALVRMRIFSNVLTQTISSTHYWASAPVLYQWTAGSPVQFLPLVKRVSAVVRGMPHLPDGATLATRDGLRLELDATDRGDGGLWSAIQSSNLHGALVDVATLLVDEARFAGPGWADLSGMGSVHVFRWRGAVSTVAPYDFDSGILVLACDTVEPVLAWPTARDVTKNEPRDVGKRYPIPVGLARAVDLVGFEVGHATTLAADVAETGTTAWSITDGEGFPTSGTWTAKCGDELVTINGGSSTPTSLAISARGASGTTSAKHSRGATVVEFVREARWILSAREVRSIGGLFWQVPSGERVRLEPGTFGFNPAASEIETGQRMAVVTMARNELERALEVAASVIQAPEFSGDGVAIAKLTWGSFAETVDGTASVGPAVHSVATVNADNPAGIRVDWNGGVFDEVGVFWTTVTENATAKVIRVRPVFDLRVDSIAGNATEVYYEVDSHVVDGSILFQNKTLLVSQTGTTTTRQQIAGDWMTPDAPDPGLEGFTVADLVGSSVSSAFRCALYLDMSSGSAGAGFFVYSASSYWEVEIEPPTATSQLPLDVAAAGSVGSGVRLFADCLGIVERAGEAAVSVLDFSTTTGWSSSNCTISVQTIASRQGIRLASPTDQNCDLVRTGLSLDWSAAGGTISFEVYITAAFKDKLDLSVNDGRYVELKVGTDSSNRYIYPFSPGDLVDDAWTTLTADLTYHYSRVTQGSPNLAAVARVELGPKWDTSGGSPQIHFRNVRFMTRALVDHPIDVGEFVIEQLAGLTGAVDATPAATAKTNLPSVKLAGDLRNAGEAFADLLGRIGFESRTNWIPVEGASGTLYRPLTPSTSFNFPSAARTLTLFRGLRTELRALDEVATEFSALWDYRPDGDSNEVEAFRKVTRADATVNEISARVLTASIAEAQESAGVRASVPQPFVLLGDLGALVEVWAYYVKEAVRFPGKNARRFSMVVDFLEAWDLEPGDVVSFVTPWDGTTVKCRITRVAFPPDAPGIGLSLEQVI